jgi:arginyl-tRNA synthetase
MQHAQSMEELIVAELARHLPLSQAELLPLLQTPPSPEMGDYGVACFALSKHLRKAPDAIVRDLQGKVQLPEGVSEARAVGPYLNFFLDRPAVARRVLGRVCREGAAYGHEDAGAGRTVVVEYGSPNIAKHLGVHHLPSAVIGRSLSRIYQALGYRCVSVNFLGDWGTSFGRLIAAVERYRVPDVDKLTVSDLQDLYVRYSKETVQEPGLRDAAREAFRRLEAGEPHARALWTAFKEVSQREFDRVYGMLGVSFDSVTPESLYVERARRMVQELLAEGIAVESAGAVIVPLDEGALPPCMIRKSDGASLYATRDIPAALDRWERHRFDRSLYVVGNEQSLYFSQLKAVLRRMGHEWADRMVHVNFGLVKFRDAQTGQARVGSTRRGEMLLLEEVLDEAVRRARAKIQENLDRLEDVAAGQGALDELAAQVGIGAVVFSELSTRRMRDVVFDWERILDFEGDTGPYVQYAHARLCSILRKAGRDASVDVDFGRLGMTEEWVLVRHLERFPAAVRRAAETYEPSIVASYLLELCADFSSYYSAGMREPERRVLCADDEVCSARLLLVDAARHVVRNGLALLGIAAPERM